MGVIGERTKWAGVIDDQAPRIVKLIAEVWKQVPPGVPDEREDDITNRLCLALQRSRTARKMMFYIHPQPVELDPETGDEFGRMDIAFYPTNQPWVPCEDVYFCVECKRLNVIKDGKPRSYASEYVTLGMMRFVSGQYSRSVRHGCMVGYVRDGNVPHAMGNVDANVRQRCVGLQMVLPGGLNASGFLPRLATARETQHRRTKGGVSLRLHHLFMAGDLKTAAMAVAAASTVEKTKSPKQARRSL